MSPRLCVILRHCQRVSCTCLSDSLSLYDDFGAKSLVPVQYPIRRLIVRSHKVSRPRELSDCPEIDRHIGSCWQGASQISKRCDNLNYQPHGFESSRDLTILSYRVLEQGLGIYRVGIGNYIPQYSVTGVNTHLHELDTCVWCHYFDVTRRLKSLATRHKNLSRLTRNK